jgi:hypothetical protein
MTTIKTLKHKFFMAPAERAAQHLSRHIQESNALNKAIQIDLVSEDDDDEDISKTARSSCANGFFQKRKRVKTTSRGNLNNNNSINLKKISYSEPPPYPLKFQLYKICQSPFEAKYVSPSIIKPILPVFKSLNQNTWYHESVPLALIIKESYSEISMESLTKLNNTICDRSIGISNKNLFTPILNEIEVSLNSDYPILWIFTGPPGSGKTKLVENISESLNLRLITIDSTQSPRNSKTFETLQTTLSHSTPRSFSQFFSGTEKQQQKMKKEKIAILFDEVEIAFESDRGYWSALSNFLQSPAAKAALIFITSNASIHFLQTIIKLPDHFRFTFIGAGDYRKLSINSDFISRLHRIDTSIEYEQLALITGYHIKSENPDIMSDFDEIESSNDYKCLIDEALRWNGILENIKVGSADIDEFSYAESASLADILLSVTESSVKINMDYSENLQSEFFTYETNDLPIVSNSLLYSNIPEVCENIPETSAIARELLGRTIYPFVNSKQINIPDSNQKIEYWKDLSKRLALRFFDYTKSLQCPQAWKLELLNHVISIENDNFIETFSRNRGRRKKAYYRYIGEELLNEILNLRHENSI